jgi:6-phosphogluconolactonase
MRTESEGRLDIAGDAAALAHSAADWLVATARAKEGSFAVALSGGSTPRPVYELLAAPPRRDLFPWSRTHWFWGDERFVPHDDPESNYRMVREAMLARVSVPETNIHAVPTEGIAPEAAAAAYERELKSFYGAAALQPERPLFDVVLLGLGSDGHMASLFPGSAMLEERKRWVGAVIGVKPEPRITLTFPVLESSRHTAFLVAGAGKRAILERFLHRDAALPAARLRPGGTLRCFVDRAAAPRGSP